MEIKGKVFIVTGGASGLGEGTARMLSGHGAKVVLADLQAERGEAVGHDLLATGIGRGHGIAGNQVLSELEGLRHGAPYRVEGRRVQGMPVTNM